MSDDTPTSRPAVRRRTFLEACGIALLALSPAPLVNAEVRIARERTTVTLLANLRGPVGQREIRAQRDPRDDPAEIYGTPIGAPLELVIPGGPSSPLLVPAPDAPERHFLPVESLAQFRRPLAERGLGALYGLAWAATGLLTFLTGRARRRRRESAGVGGPSVKEA